MKSKKEWETESLEWIHKIREEMDEDIRQKGISPAQWIKERGTIDVKKLCKSLNLNNVKVSKRKKGMVSL